MRGTVALVTAPGAAGVPGEPFRGPYADGVPAAALEVDAPSLVEFRLVEWKRMATVATVMSVFVLRALARGGIARLRSAHGDTTWDSVIAARVELVRMLSPARNVPWPRST